MFSIIIRYRSSADPGAGQPSGLRVGSPGSARRGTATSATRSPPMSTAALRASPKPESRSCSVRRNAGRTPSLRSVGGLRPIRARTRSLRARLGRSERYGATDSGAVSAGSNPVGGTGQRHKFEHSDNLERLQCQRCDLRKRGRVPDLAPYTCPTAKAGPANCLLSSITRSRSLGRKQAVAPAPTLQLNGGGLHPKHPPTRGLPGGRGNLSHLLGTGTRRLIGSVTQETPTADGALGNSRSVVVER